MNAHQLLEESFKEEFGHNWVFKYTDFINSPYWDAAIKAIDMLFTNKQEKKEIVHQFFAPPPPPKEVAKIQTMLRQVETWINAGETELAEKHWILISDECRKYGT